MLIVPTSFLSLLGGVFLKEFTYTAFSLIMAAFIATGSIVPR